MHSNVRKSCHDWHGEYPAEMQTDTRGILPVSCHLGGVSHVRAATTVAIAVAAIGVAGSVLAGQSEDAPTHAGILRLTRAWQWCDKADFASGGVPVPTPDRRLDLDRLPRVRRARCRQADRVIWRAFTPPSRWRGRPVWITYDARRLSGSDIRGISLNDKPLPIALPVPGERGYVAPKPNPEAGPDASANWFVNIGSRLAFGQPNVVAIHLGLWPPAASAGIWIYCPPVSERVAFVVSQDVPSPAQLKIRRFAEQVAQYFAVRPLVEISSFRTPHDLREHLRGLWRDERISGALLIGRHPVALYSFSGKKKPAFSHPRFYEDLDARFVDENNDGIFEDVQAGKRPGAEIWTSWIRLLPEYERKFDAYIDKVEAYYERRLCVPKEPIVIAKTEETLGDHRHRVAAGLCHYDDFMRPSFLAIEGAHAGTGYVLGPHHTVRHDALNFFPGAVFARIGGCHAGDIDAEHIKPPEAYLFGRSNCLLASSTAPTVGGAGPLKQERAAEQLVGLLPHMAPFYVYLADLRTHASEPHDHAEILFGNPFIRPGAFAAPAGTIVARATDEPVGRPMEGLYVGAYRDGECFGRVRTGTDGTGTLACLPPARYTLRLHVNALEHLEEPVVVRRNDRIVHHWRLKQLWTVRGAIVDPNGKLEPHAWVQIAKSRDERQFGQDADLLPALAGETGHFQIVGTRSRRFWLRARSLKRFVSDPLEMNLRPGDSRDAVTLRVEVPDRRGARGRDTGADEFLAFEPRECINVAPSDETVHPLLDVRAVHILLLPRDAPTMRLIPRRRTIPRAEYSLRLAVELAQPLPEVPGAQPAYVLYIQTASSGTNDTREGDRADHLVTTRYSRSHARWGCKLKCLHEEPVFFVARTWPTNVVERWLIVDAVLFAGNEGIDWRFCLETALTLDGKRIRRRIPESGEWRLRGSLGDMPFLEIDTGPH